MILIALGINIGLIFWLQSRNLLERSIGVLLALWTIQFIIGMTIVVNHWRNL